MNVRQRWAAAAVAILAVATSAPSHADDGFQAGNLMVRLRGVVVAPDVSNDAVSLIGGNVGASTTVIPEVDFSYFVTPNISAELIAGTTQHHMTDNNSAAGTVDLGKVWLLPPTLTAQYHFFPDQAFRPYVGAGVNYTFFYDSEAQAGSIAYHTHYSNSWGAALQAGFDYHVSGNWYANLDLKKIFLTTTATIDDGLVTSKVHLDPWLIGFGVGYLF